MTGNIDGVCSSRVRLRPVDLIRSFLCVCLRPTYARNTRALTRQPQRNGVSNASPRAGHNRNLILESHIDLLTLIKIQQKWRVILSASEDSQERNLDRERFLDIVTELIAQFFQPLELAQDLRRRKTLGERAGFCSRVR